MPIETDNTAAIEAALGALHRDFGDLLAPELLRRVAESSVPSVRRIIESEHTEHLVALVTAEHSIQVRDDGVTIVEGDWRLAEHGRTLADIMVGSDELEQERWDALDRALEDRRARERERSGEERLVIEAPALTSPVYDRVLEAAARHRADREADEPVVPQPEETPAHAAEPTTEPEQATPRSSLLDRFFQAPRRRVTVSEPISAIPVFDQPVEPVPAVEPEPVAEPVEVAPQPEETVAPVPALLFPHADDPDWNPAPVAEQPSLIAPPLPPVLPVAPVDMLPAQPDLSVLSGPQVTQVEPVEPVNLAVAPVNLAAVPEPDLSEPDLSEPWSPQPVVTQLNPEASPYGLGQLNPEVAPLAFAQSPVSAPEPEPALSTLPRIDFNELIAGPPRHTDSELRAL